MGTLYRYRGAKKGIWHMRYRVNGRVFRHTTGTANLTEARAILAQHEHAAALNKPVAALGLLTTAIPQVRYAILSGQALRDMKGPLAYVYVIEGRVKYVGMSRNGLERPLHTSHHLLGRIRATAGHSLMYFPVETVEEASRLEAELIELLHPEWNDGKAATPEVTDADLRAVAIAMAQPEPTEL